MGININPDSWIIGHFKNKKEHDLRIADFLDEIANEALELAKIWEKVIHSLVTKGDIDEESNKLWKQLTAIPGYASRINVQASSRLEDFYTKVSSILGKKRHDEVNFVVYKIGSILQKRRLTKDTVQVELKRIKGGKFFDDSGKINDGILLLESITILHKEAAALYSFAKEFRAKL